MKKLLKELVFRLRGGHTVDKLVKTCPCYSESYTLRQDISDEKKQEQKEALRNGAGYVA